MDVFSLVAGTALPIRVTLSDSAGLPIVTYPAATPLVAELWPGGERPASFLVAATWADPTAGTVDLLIAAAQTVGLAAGRYRGRLVVTDPFEGPLVGYEWAVDLTPAPGTEVEPPSYCRFADLLDYGRSWLPGLQGADDEAGFAEYRGRARAWLDDLILDARRSRGGASLGSPGYGASLYGAGGATPNPWLRAQLDADLLIRRPWVVECTAKKALALICDGQIGPTEAGDGYARVGRGYANEARSLALSSTAEFAAADGSTAFSIYLGGGSIR